MLESGTSHTNERFVAGSPGISDENSSITTKKSRHKKTKSTKRSTKKAKKNIDLNEETNLDQDDFDFTPCLDFGVLEQANSAHDQLDELMITRNGNETAIFKFPINKLQRETTIRDVFGKRVIINPNFVRYYHNCNASINDIYGNHIPRPETISFLLEIW